jgi:hypothetical protein
MVKQTINWTGHVTRITSRLSNNLRNVRASYNVLRRGCPTHCCGLEQLNSASCYAYGARPLLLWARLACVRSHRLLLPSYLVRQVVAWDFALEEMGKVSGLVLVAHKLTQRTPRISASWPKGRLGGRVARSYIHIGIRAWVGPTVRLNRVYWLDR